MTITINDGVSEQGATNATHSLMEITHLLVKVKLLIGQVEAECGADVSEMEQAHEELEMTAGIVFAEIFEATAEYTNEPAHTEGLETADRV